ncbi:hypothetical protein OE414_15395 [Pseudomonas aeruginosa]|nr:hypothetical protein [Pseudomonas aeruginosa]
MSSTQHQLIEQCAIRLRGIVEALDNIHDNTPHRWSTDLDDVHSSAESLLALINDQAPAPCIDCKGTGFCNSISGEEIRCPCRAPIQFADPAQSPVEQFEQAPPSEDQLIAAGLSYPLAKEDAVKLWYSGFRSEVITVLEAWEAIGHDTGINPDKEELLESLRNMAAICNAHGNDMPAQSAIDQRQVIADAITGALAFGAQASQPPAADHWLRPFYDIGRAEGQRTQELSMLVRMLASSLKRHAPESNLVARATNYLAAKGLAGTPLRDAPASVEQAGGDERVKCAVCVDSGKVYDISGEGPWKCYACTGSHEVIGYANGDELDNMLDDRTAVLSPVKTSFHTVPVYREARAALAQPSDEVVVTKNESGAIVSVTRQDKEGRVLSVIAESQPSPAQAEQAEAERPIVSFEKYMQVMYDRDENAKRLDAALARIAELEAKLSDPTAVHQWQFSNAWFDGSEEVVLKAGKEGSPIRTLYAAPVAQAQHSAPDVCDGKEQNAFEEWARKEGLDTSCHPMHWLFLDAKTNSARQGWKAALRYVRAHIAAPSQAQHSVPEGWMLVPVEPLLNMMSDKDHDTRITAERQLLSILAAAPGNSVPQAWLDVQAERRRQITAEGWTPEHDDEHADGQMAQAAGCYALHAGGIGTDWPDGRQNGAALFWPWDRDSWKPTTPRRDLVKACALALAEIERLDRAGISQSPQPGATTASS